jgi:hypothetical protein
VLAGCAEDEVCSFLTVSMTGSEVSCDFYAWTSDNFACTFSEQVRCGPRGGCALLLSGARHALLSSEANQMTD